MKNKILLAVVMLFFVGICCIPMKSYAVICDSIGHNYVGATCTAGGTCTRCNGTGPKKSHSYGSWYRAKNPTCTDDGYDRKDCKGCSDYQTSSVSKLGHTGGSVSDKSNSSQHWKICTRCGGGYDYGNHDGDWYPDGSSHYKDCSICKKKKYTSGAHDNNVKVDIIDDDNEHKTYCESCWANGYTDKETDKGQYQGKEAHKPWVGGEDPTKHNCPACSHQMYDTNKYYHRYPGLSDGFIDKPFYSCDVCNITASIQNGSYSELHMKGLPESKYVASDASIKMEDIPEFPHETYTLYWTADGEKNPTLRDGNHNKVLPRVNPADVAIESWGRKSLKTHAVESAEYAKETFEAQMKLNGYAVIGSEYLITSEEELFKITDMINSDINRASEYEKMDWNGVLHEMCRNVYRNNYDYKPTVTQNGTEYELTFSHGQGRMGYSS